MPHPNYDSAVYAAMNTLFLEWKKVAEDRTLADAARDPAKTFIRTFSTAAQTADIAPEDFGRWSSIPRKNVKEFLDTLWLGLTNKTNDLAIEIEKADKANIAAQLHAYGQLTEIAAEVQIMARLFAVADLGELEALSKYG